MFALARHVAFSTATGAGSTASPGEGSPIAGKAVIWGTSRWTAKGRAERLVLVVQADELVDYFISNLSSEVP